MRSQDEINMDLAYLRGEIRNLEFKISRLVGDGEEIGRSDDQLVDNVVRKEIKSRQIRFEMFKRQRFGEIGWEILLILYLDVASETKLSVGDVSHKVQAPMTTILRRLDVAVNEGLVRRGIDKADNRRTLLQITRKGMMVVEAWATRISGM